MDAHTWPLGHTSLDFYVREPCSSHGSQEVEIYDRITFIPPCFVDMEGLGRGTVSSTRRKSAFDPSCCVHAFC